MGPYPTITVTWWGAASRYLLSIWDMDGAVVGYNASTLEELKRLSMVNPSGKYSVYKKISLSGGTSH